MSTWQRYEIWKLGFQFVSATLVEVGLRRISHQNISPGNYYLKISKALDVTSVHGWFWYYDVVDANEMRGING